MNQREWEESVLMSLKHQTIQDWINHSTILLRIFLENEVQFSQWIKENERKESSQVQNTRPYKLELITVQFCYVYFQEMKYNLANESKGMRGKSPHELKTPDHTRLN